MNKRIFIPALLIVAILAIGYAVYRSTSETVTIIQNGQQVVYGEPQHGLTLGLCIFAGFCVIGSIMLLLDYRKTIHKELQQPNSASAVPGRSLATNYPFNS